MPGPEPAMPADAAASYDDDYGRWKDWRGEAFATLPAAVRDYLDKEIARLGPQPIRRVLEIGFGNGQFLRYARERGWQVSGTEAIAGLVGRARAAGFDAHPAAALESLPAGAFDLVVAFDVLEHIPQAELVGFLRAMGRCLAPAGVMLCRFPNGDSPFGRPFQNGDVTHRTIIGEAKLNYLARAAGLKVLSLRGEARPTVDRSPRMVLSRLVVRLLEWTIEPCIKRVMFPGWRFALFSPNSVARLCHAPPPPPGG